MSDFNRLYRELPASRDEFVAEGMVLVKQQVAKRLRLCPGWRHMQPDLEGEGYVALAELLQTSGVKNPAAWLTASVRRSINRATKHAPTAPLPEWAVDEGPACAQAPLVLEDALELAADAIDRRIIAGRAEGFSDPELGDQLHLTSQAVGKRRRAMRDKWSAPIDKSAKGGRQGDRRRH